MTSSRCRAAPSPTSPPPPPPLWYTAATSAAAPRTARDAPAWEAPKADGWDTDAADKEIVDAPGGGGAAGGAAQPPPPQDSGLRCIAAPLADGGLALPPCRPVSTAGVSDSASACVPRMASSSRCTPATTSSLATPLPASPAAAGRDVWAASAASSAAMAAAAVDACGGLRVGAAAAAAVADGAADGAWSALMRAACATGCAAAPDIAIATPVAPPGAAGGGEAEPHAAATLRMASEGRGGASRWGVAVRLSPPLPPPPPPPLPPPRHRPDV